MSELTNDERIGQAAIELMDNLRESHPNGMIETVAVVASVAYEDDDGDGCNDVLYWCSDERKWVQAGLLSEALDLARVR